MNEFTCVCDTHKDLNSLFEKNYKYPFAREIDQLKELNKTKYLYLNLNFKLTQYTYNVNDII